MRGRKTIYPITLTDERKKPVQQLGNAVDTPQGKARRAKVILLAAEAGCSEKTVRTWRARWCQEQSLEDRPQPGRPRVFSLRCVCQFSPLKQVLLDFIQYHDHTARPIKLSYTLAKLEKKSGDETQPSVVPCMLELVDQLAAHQLSLPAYTVEMLYLADKIFGRN
jgi:hypothetical protein